MFPEIKDSYFKKNTSFDVGLATDVLINKALDNKNDDGTTNGIGSFYILKLKKYLKSALALQCKLHIAIVLLNDVLNDTLPNRGEKYNFIIERYCEEKDFKDVIIHSIDSIFNVERSIKRQKSLAKCLISKTKVNRVDKKWEIVFKRFINKLYSRLNYIENSFFPEIIKATPCAALDDEIRNIKHSQELQVALFNGADKNAWRDSKIDNNTLLFTISQIVGALSTKSEEELEVVNREINSNYQTKLEYINSQKARIEKEAQLKKDEKEAEKKELKEKKAFLYETAEKLLEEKAKTAEEDLLSYKTTTQIKVLKREQQNYYAVLFVKFSNKMDVDDLKVSYGTKDMRTTGIVPHAKFFKRYEDAETLLVIQKSKSSKNLHILGKIVEVDISKKDINLDTEWQKKEFHIIAQNIQKKVELTRRDVYLEYLAQECKCDRAYLVMFYVRYKNSNRALISYGSNLKSTTTDFQKAALFQSYEQALKCVRNKRARNANNKLVYKICTINLSKYSSQNNKFLEEANKKLRIEVENTAKAILFKKEVEKIDKKETLKKDQIYILMCASPYTASTSFFVTINTGFTNNFSSYCYFQNVMEIEVTIETIRNNNPNSILLFQYKKIEY